MSHRISLRTTSLLALSVLSFGFLQPQSLGSIKDQNPTHLSQLASESSVFQALVVISSRNDLSPVLSDIQPAPERLVPSETEGIEIPNPVLPKAIPSQTQETGEEQYMLEMPMSPATMPTPVLNFDGVANLFGGWPPDTQGDIGPDHYVQWINLHFAIWRIDKTLNTATLVYGPVPGNTLFQGFGGACENTNNGDPITLYDPLAQRWFMSQFALPNWPYGPFYECVAVSQTANPTGAWYRYEFQMPVNKMNDYPKIGVWPDAYYMTVNQFNGGSMSWGGAGVAALERSAMINGSPALMVYFDLYNVDSNYGGMLPADFDGTILPPSDSPGFFAQWDDSTWIPSYDDAVRLWEFHVDWDNPSNSTFGVGGNPNLVIPTDDVNPDLCGYSRSCIPQPGTSTKVDAISDRLMYRLQYRNFGGYETLVTNHSVDVSGADRSGIHWFELRTPEGASPSGWSMHQQGVYSPDANHRWMGSAAMDHTGNLALGYSVSSSSVYPSVRYTGRLVADDLGTLPQGEQSLIEGSGSQTGSSRWGDYSMLGLDPLDDCTFWYTQMYVATTGSNSWKTRIGSFRFPNCSIGFRGTLQGTVIDSSTLLGIDGAQIRATVDVTRTYPTLTKSDGTYSMQIPVETYEVTASEYGYLPSTVTGVEIFSGTVTTQDFSLTSAPLHVISGTVSDVNTGWSLYAQITIGGAPIDSIWSNPVTGYYSVTLPEGLPYTFLVQADLPGYIPASIPVGPLTSDMTQNIPLEVDETACEAPGYQLNITPAYTTDFEANNGGFTSSGTTSWAWGAPISGPGVAHSGVNVWATNLEGNYNSNENGYITSPTIDLSGYVGESPAISWWQWLMTEDSYDNASLEVSKNGGTSWDLVYGPVSGAVDEAWKRRHVFLDSSYAVGNFLIRFHFTSDATITLPGWYVDDLAIGPGSCEPQEGGLVAGNVFDANSFQGLVGATVTSGGGLSTTSQATPLDPEAPDGLYTLFSPSGTHTFTATMTGGYQSAVETPSVQLNETVLQNFDLEAGWLSAYPLLLETALELGDSIVQPLTLTNQGGITATFELFELEKGMVPSGPFEEPSFVVKSFKQNLPNSQGLGIPAPPVGAPLAAGEVIQSWEVIGATGPWGIAYDGINGTVWISSPSASWGGDDKLYEFTTAGAATGRSYPHSAPHSVGPADMAYDWKTGMLWAMNVNSGVSNCIYEIDPLLGYTGDYVCPGGGSGFSISQRGLAYDPTTDTWFAGGWNDLMVYRFDSAGNILSSVQTGLGIAGLAYNPETQHLFVMVNGNPNKVYVLDVANNYTLIGEFSVSQDFGNGAGAGMEFDCNGDLWAVDMTTDKVYQFSSGESANLCEFDVPWLREDPVSGDVESSGHALVDLTFDAGVPEIDQPGVYQAQLKVKEDTPYYFPNLPVTMTVTAPSTWGKLKGTVSGLGYCDANPAPLEGVEVVIESSGGVSWTLSTTAAGYYQRWFDEAGSPYTITVTATEQTLGQVSGLLISGGVTLTQDVALHWLQPCVSVDPELLDVVLKIGRSMTVPITLSNDGYSFSDFEFVEIPVDGALLRMNTAPTRSAVLASPDVRVAPSQAGFEAPIYAPQFSDILIEEGFESGSVPPDGWTKAASNVRTWLPYSTSAHTGIYSAYVPYDYNQDEWLLSPELYLSEGVLSLWSMGSIYWCRGTYNNCDLNVWIVVGDVGDGDDIYVGRADDDWSGSYTWSQSVFDLTSLLPGSVVRLGFQYSGSDGADVAIDDISLEGKEGSDVPWLSLSPISGTLPANTSIFPVDAIFDAGIPEVVEPGEYHALVKLRSDDPVRGSITIPVTMTVIPLEYGVDISGDMVLHDIPGETVTYTLQVTNTGEGPVDSFVISLGTHAWTTTVEPWVVGPLDMGESTPLEISVGISGNAIGGDFESLVVAASSLGDPTKFATTTLTTTVDTPLADIEVSKVALADPVYVGASLTYDVTITNHGPTKAPRVTLIDILPLGVVYLSATSSVGEAGCTLTDYVLVCELGKFLNNEIQTITIVVRPMKLGNLTNHAFAIADADDPDPDNNWDYVKVLVEGLLMYYPFITR
jgi:uncharacterized repeat protein (TIGR01451 family)